ncbi:8-oxo-dGTP diphosphatase [Streptomyces zhaozhouensis]|uniref:8-oxo-dGTP diphosphatase n=1 Tax=Streptomyces zhaozhouensis TaxID=1300267 RepID=A0A286E1L5_9ACTN|nr:NUDIX hydrolase [Streptomyces zhaozhouensis]SOD64780.1 8-oxo-dGTP diphosphatase [Streptomyces zhaozhouensis]
MPREADGALGAPVILAAGCVLWRAAADGGVEVALVHRPRYDDWSHPKGKLDPGETAAAAARREVLEETGMRCELGRTLSTQRYSLPGGLLKRVDYWLARVTGGRFLPNEEVDALRWLPAPEAGDHLTYPQDRALLVEAAGALRGGGA